MAGYNSQPTYKANQIGSLIYVKTNIGGWFFDAFLRVDHTRTLRITEHPVQTGASVTDHAFLEPATLTIEVGMSDVAESLIEGQFSGGWSRSSTAFKVLTELQANRMPLQVLTKLGIYKNMLIESISAPDDYLTLFGMKSTVTMKELLVARVTTVKLSKRPNTTDKTNRGTAVPVQPNESILYQILGGKAASK